MPRAHLLKEPLLLFDRLSLKLLTPLRYNDYNQPNFESHWWKAQIPLSSSQARLRKLSFLFWCWMDQDLSLSLSLSLSLFVSLFIYLSSYLSSYIFIYLSIFTTSWPFRFILSCWAYNYSDHFFSYVLTSSRDKKGIPTKSSTTPVIVAPNCERYRHPRPMERRAVTLWYCPDPGQCQFPNQSWRGSGALLRSDDQWGQFRHQTSPWRSGSQLQLSRLESFNLENISCIFFFILMIAVANPVANSNE